MFEYYSPDQLEQGNHYVLSKNVQDPNTNLFYDKYFHVHIIYIGNNAKLVRFYEDSYKNNRVEWVSNDDCFYDYIAEDLTHLMRDKNIDELLKDDNPIKNKL